MIARMIPLMIFALGIGHVVADELPARKPGLWQITRSPPRPKLPPQVQKICLDAATDALLYQLGSAIGRRACSSLDVHRSGDKVTVSSVCKLGTTVATSHNVMTWHGAGAYHEDIAVHFNPPLGKTSDSNASQEAQWLGACPVDMKPGDIVTEPSALMPITMRMNIRDLLKNTK